MLFRLCECLAIHGGVAYFWKCVVICESVCVSRIAFDLCKFSHPCQVVRDRKVCSEFFTQPFQSIFVHISGAIRPITLI